MGMEMNHALSLRMPREEKCLAGTINDFELGRSVLASGQGKLKDYIRGTSQEDCNEMEIVCTKYILDIWMKV